MSTEELSEPRHTKAPPQAAPLLLFLAMLLSPLLPGVFVEVRRPPPVESAAAWGQMEEEDWDEWDDDCFEEKLDQWRDEVREASGRVLDFYCIPRVKLYMQTCLYLAYVALLIWCFTLSTDLTTGELPVVPRLVSRAL